jgi:hypothetical protein
LALFANQTEKIFETLHDDMGRFEPSVSAQTSGSQIIVTKKLRQAGLTLSDCGHTVSSRRGPQDSRPWQPRPCSIEETGAYEGQAGTPISTIKAAVLG